MHQESIRKWLLGGRTSGALPSFGIYIYAHVEVCSWSTCMPSFERTTHYAKWPPTRTKSFRSCQTAAAATMNNSTLGLKICPRHWVNVGHRNTSARGRWRRKKSDAALAKIADDPSFPFLFIGSTSGSCTGAAWMEQSRGFFRHEAPVNVPALIKQMSCPPIGSLRVYSPLEVIRRALHRINN